jgi:hypothetical protein
MVCGFGCLVAGFKDSLSTILHNSRRSAAAGRVARPLLLKDNQGTTDSLRLEVDSHVDAVADCIPRLENHYPSPWMGAIRTLVYT